MDRIHERRWFVDVNGSPAGPFSWELLQQHAREGRFAPHHRVRAEDWPDWLPAAQVPALFPPAQFTASPDAVTRALLPVRRSGLAITAGYLGLLSLIPFVGPFALLTGALALRGLRANPQLHGAGRAWFGIIMGALFTALYAFAFLA